MRWLVISICGLVLSAGTASAWTYARDGSAANAVLLLDGSDVVSAGGQFDAQGKLEAVVVRHSVIDGSETWHYVVQDDHAGIITALTRDVAETIYAASYHGPQIGFVTKLSSQDGSEIWRQPVQSRFKSLAVAPNGDVLAVGTKTENGIDRMTIAKYSGVDGSELWQHIPPSGFDGPDEGTSLVVNPDGGAFVGGSLSENPDLNYPDFVVMRLSGDGREMWRYVLPSLSAHGGLVWAMGLDPTGNLIAGGHAVRIGWCDWSIVKLNPANGTELWRSVYDVGGCDNVSALDVDFAGDVIATGGNVLFVTMKVSGADGSLLWRHDIPNLAQCMGGRCALGVGVRIDTDGNAVVIGGDPSSDIVAAKLSGADGAEIWRRILDFDGCVDAPSWLAMNDRIAAIGASMFKKVNGSCAWPQGAQYAAVRLNAVTGSDLSWMPEPGVSICVVAGAIALIGLRGERGRRRRQNRELGRASNHPV